MNSKFDFHEIRSGTVRQWDSVCLTKDKTMATYLVNLLRAVNDEQSFFIRGIEITTRLEIGEPNV